MGGADMTTGHKLTMIAAVVLLLSLTAAGVLIARQLISQARSDERSKADAEKQQDLEQQKKASDDAAEKANAALEAERAKPATVDTVTKFVPVPLPAGSQVKLETLPDAPTPQVVLTGDAQKNLDAIVDMEIAHKECDNSLAACKRDNDIAAKKLKTMTDDRNQQRDRANGGNKWHRLGKGLKCLTAGAGGAALGAVIAGAKGAAIGSVSGGGVCEVAF